MKTIFKLILSVAAWIVIASGTNAQDQKKEKAKNPRWISDKGFWQIESNVTTPDRNIIYFYNNENILVYKEHLNGVVLDLQKKSVKMRLKKVLETAVEAWNKDLTPQSDRQWISMQFKD